MCMQILQIKCLILPVIGMLSPLVMPVSGPGYLCCYLPQPPAPVTAGAGAGYLSCIYPGVKCPAQHQTWTNGPEIIYKTHQFVKHQDSQSWLLM